jgi:hypothetical protein
MVSAKEKFGLLTVRAVYWFPFRAAIEPTVNSQDEVELRRSNTFLGARRSGPLSTELP